MNLSWLEALGTLLKWLVAFMVALLVMGFFLLVLRFILGRLGRTKPRPFVAPLPLQLENIEDDFVDVPSQDLLAGARQALAEERFDQAILLARASALRTLSEAERLVLHRSYTDRDYLRTVRKDRALFEPLRALFRVVEACRWAGIGADRARATQALKYADALVKGALVLLFLTIVSSPTLALDPESPYGPNGGASLHGIFEEEGYEVSWRMRPIRSLDEEVNYLVLDTTAVAMGTADWEHLRGWVSDGGWLLVIGDLEEGFPEFGQWGQVASMQPWSSYSPGMRPTLPGGVAYGYWDSKVNGWLLAEGKRVVVVDEGENPAEAVDGSQQQVMVMGSYLVGKGVVVGIADPWMVSNAAMLVDGNARLIGGVFQHLESEYYIPTPAGVEMELALFGGAASSSAMESLFHARLLPVVLQLLLLALVATLWLGWPFGPLRDRSRRAGRQFSDHARALGYRYWRAGASEHALVCHIRLFLLRLGSNGLESAYVRSGASREEARAKVDGLQKISVGEVCPDGSESMKLLEELWNVTKTN
jgi:hypothetical protein